MQVVIALVVTPQGFPMAYEVVAANTSGNTTLLAGRFVDPSRFSRRDGRFSQAAQAALRSGVVCDDHDRGAADR